MGFLRYRGYYASATELHDGDDGGNGERREAGERERGETGEWHHPNGDYFSATDTYSVHDLHRVLQCSVRHQLTLQQSPVSREANEMMT